MNAIKIPASTAIAAAAGAATTVIVWALKQWGHVDVPTDVGMAITTIITVAAGHFVQDAAA